MTAFHCSERHLVEGAVLGDAGIVDQHVDRTEIGLDLLDAGGAGVERADVPFVDGDAGLRFELLGSRVVAGVARRDLVARSLQRLADRRANAARTPRHQCNTCHVVVLLGAFFDTPELSRSFDESTAGLSVPENDRTKCPARDRAFIFSSLGCVRQMILFSHLQRADSLP